MLVAVGEFGVQCIKCKNFKIRWTKMDETSIVYLENSSKTESNLIFPRIFCFFFQRKDLDRSWKSEVVGRKSHENLKLVEKKRNVSIKSKHNIEENIKLSTVKTIFIFQDLLIYFLRLHSNEFTNIGNCMNFFPLFFNHIHNLYYIIVNWWTIYGWILEMRYHSLDNRVHHLHTFYFILFECKCKIFWFGFFFLQNTLLYSYSYSDLAKTYSTILYIFIRELKQFLHFFLVLIQPYLPSFVISFFRIHIFRYILLLCLTIRKKKKMFFIYVRNYSNWNLQNFNHKWKN